MLWVQLPSLAPIPYSWRTGYAGSGGASVERDAVLFANEAFYRAFVDRDLATMEQVWSRRDSVVCIHPG